MLTGQAWGPRRRLINPGDCVDRIICDIRAATIVRLVMRIRHFIKVPVVFVGYFLRALCLKFESNFR